MHRIDVGRNLVAAAAVVVVLLSASALSATTLSVTPAAAISGNHGLQINFTGDTANALVIDDSPVGETCYSASFTLRHNLMTMVAADTHQVLRTRMGGSTPVVRLQVKRANDDSNFIIFVWARLDNGTFTVPLMVFAPNQHLIKVNWKAATSDGANDGGLQLWKGANLISEYTNLDNDTYVVDDVNFGAFGGVDATTTGEVHLDDFVSTRECF